MDISNRRDFSLKKRGFRKELFKLLKNWRFLLSSKRTLDIFLLDFSQNEIKTGWNVNDNNRPIWHPFFTNPIHPSIWSRKVKKIEEIRNMLGFLYLKKKMTE